jgi:hypothetical protein
MSMEDISEQDKKALYWLGERLIDYRNPIMVAGAARHRPLRVLELPAEARDELRRPASAEPSVRPDPQQVRGTFGGANNIQLMVEVKEGNIFNVQTLARIYKITEAVDQVYGVNHNQIDSIGHRTTRYLRAQSGGFLRAEPVMIGLPKSPDDAANIRRIVHNTESVYGILVSLDDKAALVAANFIEGPPGPPPHVHRDQRARDRAVRHRLDRRAHQGQGSRSSPTASRRPSSRSSIVVRPRATPSSRPVTSSSRSTASPPRTAPRWPARCRSTKPGEEITLGYKRANDSKTVKIKVPERELQIFVAGEPRLYGWVYNYAGDVFWIFTVTYCMEWILRWMYFHDWRGALRPTLTGIIAAFWGLGFVHLIGFALDPLILVMPFLITARAVSHAIQMHDRYYEEFERHNWDQRKAIVAALLRSSSSRPSRAS